MAWAKGASAKTWLPRWAWIPRKSTDALVGQLGQPLHSVGGRPRRDAEAELGVLLAGPHELVGMHLDARRHPGQHRDRGRGRIGRSVHQSLQAVDLVEGVDDDAAHSGLEGHGQLVVRLVVAVEDQTIGRDAGRQGHVHLAAGGDIETEPLLVGQTGHGQAQECLGGIGDTVTPCLAGLATAGPQMGFVVDEQRGTEFVGQVDEIETPDPEATGGIDGGRHGQELVGHRVRRIGACARGVGRLGVCA